MNATENIPNFETRVRVLQIITFALVMGVVMFGAVVVLLLRALEPPAATPVISGIAAGFAVFAIVLHVVLPKIIVRNTLANQGPKANPESLLNVYQTQHIIALALLEGAAFFNLVATILEHHVWSIAVAVALVMIMLSRFPTQTRRAQWLETQRFSLDQNTAR